MYLYIYIHTCIYIYIYIHIYTYIYEYMQVVSPCSYLRHEASTCRRGGARGVEAILSCWLTGEFWGFSGVSRRVQKLFTKPRREEEERRS